MTDSEQPPKLTIWETAKSVAAAFFGVQTEKNRQRDFQYGNPFHFILIGLSATIVFILVVALVVKLVMMAAGV